MATSKEILKAEYVYVPYIPIQISHIVQMQWAPNMTKIYWFKDEPIKLMHQIYSATYQARSLDGKRHYVVDTTSLPEAEPRDLVIWRKKNGKKKSRTE